MVGYNPKEGDKINHGLGVDEDGRGYYRVFIEKTDRTERPGEYRIIGPNTGGRTHITRESLIGAFRQLHRNVIFKRDGLEPPNFTLLLTERTWIRFLRDAGMTNEEITNEFLRPLEFITAEYDTLDFPAERIKEVYTRIHDGCYNTESAAFELIGAHGIRVSEEWHDFENFRSWAEHTLNKMERDSTRPFTVLRRDRNKDYSPANCKIM
jgi:hypothetical protein